MKHIITLILLTLSAAAIAQPRHHGNHHYGHGGYNWLAPMVIGGVVTYALTRPAPTPAPPPGIIYVPQQPLPVPPYGFRYEQILDANCNCYRWVLVQG